MKGLLEIYQDLKESGSTSQYPQLLGNVQYKVLISKFKGVNTNFSMFTMKSSVNDFKTNDRVTMGEAPDLLEIGEGSPYKDFKFGEDKWQIQANTFGRAFSINRKVIINDDLAFFKQVPAALGRTAKRTLAKDVVKRLEGDYNSYDSKTLFHDDHDNKIATTLANTAAGAAALEEAIAKIERAQEPNSGEVMGLTAKILVVPPEMEDRVNRLIRSRELYPVSTAGGGTDNRASKISRLKVVSEPFLTGTTKCYLFADPEDCPVIEVAYLKGKETPDLLVKKPDLYNLAGGEDPYGLEFDELNYKVRFDWGIAVGMYQGVVRIG